ncbi:uncharacterized protein EMH_0059680 [Eimeria mitis]|uniref:Uncharacterized protein n=1 Tax=Eimeria mitis TaxID=44415 RepID=U6KIY3_9EIME|nr:uncharacterized protein EMH_0059680 [Eimeria mitis]CDJ36242.1 hypothetical protein EMH_0059680 [Eimeria mitis]
MWLPLEAEADGGLWENPDPVLEVDGGGPMGAGGTEGVERPPFERAREAAMAWARWMDSAMEGSGAGEDPPTPAPEPDIPKLQTLNREPQSPPPALNPNLAFVNRGPLAPRSWSLPWDEISGNS